MRIKWRSLAGPLLAFALVLGMIAMTPGLNGEAGAVNFDQACSLTVIPGGAGEIDDLASADVVLDLYRVAEAKPVSGVDTYTYAFADSYKNLADAYQKNPDNADWTALAASAAQIALNGQTPAVTAAPANAPIKDLSCGLYLVIARGANITNYTTTVKAEDGTEHLVTIAESGSFTYEFAPVLVSLPSKEADDDGHINTAGPGDWLYDFTITLKPTRADRFGSLEIVKTLTSYETKDPATFVFEVTAEKDGKVVYSNVVSMTFTSNSENPQRKKIEKLPVGANVTVKEVYSGNAYQVTTSDTQTAVILANDIVSVAFTNDYDDTHKGGGAITNHFEKVNGEWQWTKIPDQE